MHARSLRTAFTLIELLIAISIIAVLAAFSLPALHLVRDLANETKCGNNQRQILAAAQAYYGDNSNIWPCRGTTASGTVDGSATPASLFTAIGSLELLAVAEKMPTRLFVCPSAPTYGPRAAATADANAPTDLSAWAVAAASDPLQVPGYAYDWSVPTNAATSRVVIADRGVVTLAHRQRTVAVCADGHVLKIPRSAGVPSGPTLNLDGSAVTSDLFINADGGDDNIYDSAGDDGVMVQPGTGSSSRCWVR